MAPVTSTPAKAPPAGATWYDAPGADVAAALGVDPATGLSAAEAASRRERFGPEPVQGGAQGAGLAGVPAPVRRPDADRAARRRHPHAYPVKEYATGILLIVLTLFNAVLGLRQEGKAAAAIAALQSMMILKTRAPRRRRSSSSPRRSSCRATSCSSRPATSSPPTAV